MISPILLCGLSLSYSLGIFIYFLGQKSKGDESHERRIVFYSAFIIFLGLVLRVSNIIDFFDGRFTIEEISIARLYLAEVLQGKHVYSGATQLFFAGILAFWFKLFGPGIDGARWLACILGASGLVFYFLAVRRIFSNNTAWIATAFLAISGFGISFSTFALEVVSVLFFCLWLYGYSCIRLKRNILGYSYSAE